MKTPGELAVVHAVAEAEQRFEQTLLVGEPIVAIVDHLYELGGLCRRFGFTPIRSHPEIGQQARDGPIR